MPASFTLTTNFNFKKFTPGIRGWGGDNNANLDSLDALLQQSKAAAWVTSGIFDAARIPLATALVAGAVFVPAGSNLTFNTGTGAISLSGANVNAALGYTPLDAAQKGAANGVASLGADGKLPSSQLPALAINETFVGNDADKTAATAERGDVFKATDTGKVYILSTDDPTQAANWVEIAAGDAVSSVNGQTGTVVLTTTDIAEGANLYYTAARFNAAFAGKSTTDLAEGSNLYFTNARFDTRFGLKTTTDLAEGANLYYTQGRFDTAFGNKDSDDLAEGSTNLYYTQGRFDSAFAAKSTTDLVEGTNLYFTNARSDARFDVRLATKSTSDLAEGSNLYFTNARVDDRLTALNVAKLDVGGTWTGYNTFKQGVAGTTSFLYGIDIQHAGTAAVGPAIGYGFRLADGGGTPVLVGDVRITKVGTWADNANQSGKMSFYLKDGANGLVEAAWLSAGGVLTATSYAGSGAALTGITTTQVAEGANLYFTDARADARITAQKNQVNGIAGLDGSGKLAASVIPAMAINEVFVGLEAERTDGTTYPAISQGDVFKETDTGVTYILQGTDPTNAAHWVSITVADGYVQTVNGKPGPTVTLFTDDISEDGSPTNLWYTDARVQAFGDTRYLQLAGGTLVGFLTLHAAPTADLHAATKKYVDDQVVVASGAGVTTIQFGGQAAEAGNVTVNAADINAALGYTAADAANVVAKASRMFCELYASGPLDTAASTDTLDYNVNKGGAKAIGRVVISGFTPAAGQIEVDILIQDAPGNAPVSIYTTTANRPKLVANSGLNWTEATLPDTLTIPDGYAVLLRVIDADTDFDNVLVELYEAAA